MIDSYIIKVPKRSIFGWNLVVEGLSSNLLMKIITYINVKFKNMKILFKNINLHISKNKRLTILTTQEFDIALFLVEVLDNLNLYGSTLSIYWLFI